MDLVKDTPFEVAWQVWEARPRTTCLTVVVKGTFNIVESGECPIDRHQEALTGDQHFDEDVEHSVRYESDFAAIKPRGECFVIGSCYAAGGEPVEMQLAAFKVGPVLKKMAIIGDRQFTGLLSGQTPPIPFTEMPLCWERAFGGPSTADNPVGLGLGKSVVNGKAVIRLPNIEDPEKLIRGKRDRPAPICSTPISRSWKARSTLTGTYEARWLKTRWPWPPEDFSLDYHCAAPEDQRIRGYFRGDEEISLVNLHPEFPKARFQLPGISTNVFLRETERDVLRPMTPELDTITVDTDRGKVYCLWRAVAEVPTDSLEEYSHLFVVDERRDSGRSIQDYRSWFERRLEEIAAEERGFEPEPVSETGTTVERSFEPEPVSEAGTAVTVEAPERGTASVHFPVEVKPAYDDYEPSLVLRKTGTLPEPVPMTSPVMTPVTSSAFDEASVWVDVVLDETQTGLPLTDLAETDVPPVGSQPEPTITFDEHLQKKAAEMFAEEGSPQGLTVPETEVTTPTPGPADKPVLDKTVTLPDQVDGDVRAALQEALAERASKQEPSDKPIPETVVLPDQVDDDVKNLAAALRRQKESSDKPIPETVVLPDQVSDDVKDLAARLRQGLVKSGMDPDSPSTEDRLARTMVLPEEARDEPSPEPESEPVTMGDDSLIIDIDIDSMAAAQDQKPNEDVPEQGWTAPEESLLLFVEEAAFLDEGDASLPSEDDEPTDFMSEDDVADALARGDAPRDEPRADDWEKRPMAMLVESLSMEMPPMDISPEEPEVSDLSKTRVLPKDGTELAMTRDLPEDASKLAMTQVLPPDSPSKPSDSPLEMAPAKALTDEVDDESFKEVADEAMMLVSAEDLAAAFGGDEFRAAMDAEEESPEERTLTEEQAELRDKIAEALESGEGCPAWRLVDADLSGMDLSGGDFSRAVMTRVKLSGANLDGANFDKATLTNADLTNASLRGTSFVEAALTAAWGENLRFDRVSMSNANASEARFPGASFRECDGFRLELCDADLTGAHFEKTSLNEADFAAARVDDAIFVECSLKDVDLGSGASARRVKMDECDLEGLRASDESDFSDGSFVKAKISRGNFGRAKLDRANFSFAELDGADFAGATLGKAKLLGCTLRNARFDRAQLTGAVLGKSDLHQARFEGASLHYTDLRGCNLYNAEFLDAIMEGTLLDLANLKGTKLA